jgi:subtilisin family serine protease
MRARIVLGMIGAGLLAACVTNPPGQSATLAMQRLPGAAEPDRAQIPRQIVVTFKVEPPALTIEAGATPALRAQRPGYAGSAYARQTMARIARDYGIARVTDWYIESLGVHCVVYQAADPAMRDAIVERMRSDLRIQDAQAMNEFSTLGDTPATAVADPYSTMQHALRRIGLPAAQQLASGRGVRVAVIDTGLDDRHADLLGRMEATDNFVDRDATQFRRDRHGTAVAGAIAANAGNGQGIRGVAPQSRLIGLKACWEINVRGDAACSSLTLAGALESAIRRRVHVINLSLAGPSDRLLTSLLQQAMAQGILIVGAAPAAVRSTAPQFPASVAGVISVENADAPGAGVHAVAAPGNEVLTLAPGNRYDFASGVSISTALVSGVAALLLEKVPDGQRASFAARLPGILLLTADARPARAPEINAARAIQATLR